jgi:hypothetical protein
MDNHVLKVSAGEDDQQIELEICQLLHYALYGQKVDTDRLLVYKEGEYLGVCVTQ